MKNKYVKLPLAAVSAAVLLGSALFSAPLASAEPAPAAQQEVSPIKDTKGDPVVASVDGDDIKRSEVLGFISTLPEQYKQAPIDQLFPAARDLVIRNKLIGKKADAANLASDPEVLKKLDMAKQDIIRTVFIQRQVGSQINNAKLVDAYKDLLKKIGNVQEIHARHILIPVASDDKSKEAEDKAKEAIKKLNSGAKWEDVAKEYASGPAANNGGDLGYFAKDEMVPEFATAAFALDNNKYTKEPVKTQFGWHIIQVLDKRKRPEPDFEMVKPQLEIQLRQETLQAMTEQWEKAAKITKLDINGEPEKAAAKGKKG